MNRGELYAETRVKSRKTKACDRRCYAFASPHAFTINTIGIQQIIIAISWSFTQKETLTPLIKNTLLRLRRWLLLNSNILKQLFFINHHLISNKPTERRSCHLQLSSTSSQTKETQFLLTNLFPPFCNNLIKDKSKNTIFLASNILEHFSSSSNLNLFYF